MITWKKHLRLQDARMHACTWAQQPPQKPETLKHTLFKSNDDVGGPMHEIAVHYIMLEILFNSVDPQVLQATVFPPGRVEFKG